MRIKLSAILLIFGLILAFIPQSEKHSMHGDPKKILALTLSEESFLTPDQLARLIVTEDSTLQLIDLRPAEDFRRQSIPGAINIPYHNFIEADLERYLDGKHRSVFYAEDDYKSNYALVLAAGFGFDRCAVLKGGLKSWNEILNTEFKGGTISVRENALFETRYKARKMFTEFNSMPESLKLKYYASREIERQKLDGGCE
jgi:rhodanese-related sulfurtransferase